MSYMKRAMEDKAAEIAKKCDMSEAAVTNVYTQFEPNSEEEWYNMCQFFNCIYKIGKAARGEKL